jgi:uncharacterized delta-60 repeat protein
MRKAKTLSRFFSFFTLRSIPRAGVRYLTILSVFILWLFLPVKLHSQQVFLDYSYGTLGFAEYSFANQGPHEVKIKVQSDGKVVQAGTVFVSPWSDFIVTRLNYNGSIDSTFANFGKLILSIGTGHDYLRDIVIQSDGKILLAGDSHDVGLERSFTVVRLNSDGTLDNSFGNNGIVRTFVVSSVNVDNQLFSIALQADNKIVAGGRVLYTFMDMAMVRYNANGTLDSSFGIDGKVITHINSDDPHYSGRSSIDDILVQEDNTILVVGVAEFDSVKVMGSETLRYGLNNYLLAQYNPDGSLDGSFDGDGVVLTPMADFGLFASGHAHTVALTSDNKIMVQGEIYNNLIERIQLGLIRYNSDGSIDGTYGVNGLATASFGTAQNFHDLQIQGDGKCLIIGMTRFDTDGFAILRFNSDGTPDNSFNNGYLYFAGPSGRSYAWSAAFQDNHLIVAGYSQPDITSSTTLRFLSIRIRLTPINCNDIVPPLTVSIPDTVSYSMGVDPNTVYPGYPPASSITIRANTSGGDGNYTYLWSDNSTSQNITVSPLSETTYSVSVIDGIGCLQTASKTISVINVDCGNGKAKICHLSNDPNHPIDICVGESAVASHLAQGCSLGDCSTSIAAQRIVLETEQPNIFDLKLYPNPSRNVFTIIAQSGNVDDKIEMRIIDVSGRVIEMSKNIKPNQSFSVGENLAAGIYFVELRQRNNLLMKKLLKL